MVPVVPVVNVVVRRRSLADPPMNPRLGLLQVCLGLGLVASSAADSVPAAAASTSVSPTPLLPRQQVFHHENVLGTSLELRVRSSVEGAAARAEAVALAEVDRLGKVFSTYTPDSEFSRWQQTDHQAVAVSADLFTVLEASEYWRVQTGGAFNPAAEAFTRLWTAAARKDSRPDAADLKAAVVEVARPAFRLDTAGRTAERLSKVPLTLNAIAKGYIIEQASAAAARLPGVEGLLIEIGGDLRLRGRFAEPVAIVDPSRDAENAAPLTTVSLRDRALATSGGYRRGLTVQGQRRSHIIDPRTGEPVSRVAGVTVIAPDTTTADALSTSFSVLEPEQSLRLAEATPDVACLLVLADGRQLRSARWPAPSPAGVSDASADVGHLAGGPSGPVGPDRSATTGLGTSGAKGPPPGIPAPHAETNRGANGKPASATNAATQAATGSATGSPAIAATGTVSGATAGTTASGMELVVGFQIFRVEGGRYQRPYVAAWVEDKDGFPVRTLLLWLLQSEKGQRWIPDLRRWHRGDQIRRLAENKDLVATVSGATRNPGKYSVVWDGKDDQGAAVKPGTYTFYLESAREHGAYQLMKHEFTVGGKPFTTSLKDAEELEGVTLEYRRRANGQ